LFKNDNKTFFDLDDMLERNNEVLAFTPKEQHGPTTQHHCPHHFSIEPHRVWLVITSRRTTKQLKCNSERR